MSAALGELIPIVGVKAACEALDVPRASFYRKRGSGGLSPAVAVRYVPRALVSSEREAVLSCLHEERFQNSAPAAVYATLLAEGPVSWLDTHHVPDSRNRGWHQPDIAGRPVVDR